MRNLDEINDDEAIQILIEKFGTVESKGTLLKNFETEDLKDKAKSILKFVSLGNPDYKNILELKLFVNRDNRKFIAFKVISKSNEIVEFTTDINSFI